MHIQVSRDEYRAVEAMRGLYRQEANCQIIHDSALGRGIADPYLILVDGRVGGYGGVWNKYSPDRVMEFYTLPHLRAAALPMFRELLAVSGATEIEAQTNMPLMLLMLLDCGTHLFSENILFADAFTTQLPNPGGRFRLSTPADVPPPEPEPEPEPAPSAPASDASSSAATAATAATTTSGPSPAVTGTTASAPRRPRPPEGDWVIELDDDGDTPGGIVAAGGFLCHYNPPYGDVYMAVAESARRRGFGSYIVQEIKRVCYEAGKRPAARCNPTNAGSRKTLQRAGFLPCGRLLVGAVAASRATEAPDTA